MNQDDSGILNRRELLRAGVTGAAVCLATAAWPGLAQAALFTPAHDGTYNVKFHNQHTGESFTGAYRAGNKYLPDAFERINGILRDFRTGDVYPIDPRVIDIIYMIHEKSGASSPFEILSGYRSPQTNAALRHRSTGVARNSLHMTGQAVDIRLPGFSTRKIKEIAMNLRAGGVGYYKKSNFVHIDTGRVRHW